MSNNDVIATILQAKDHYDVLGVSKDDDTAVIRRAYLKRSVKVHPDKNGNSEQATEAFQRVAAAWQVLSDDDERRQYDLQQWMPKSSGFSSGFHQAEAGPHREQFSEAKTPSFQEALFMFATVTNMMGGNNSPGAAGSIAETLFWAERVLNQQQASGARGIDQEDNSMAQGANVAMTVGSGLKVASATMAGLGFKTQAAQLEKTARAAQMAGMGAMALDAAKDNPAVKRMLDQGSRALGEGGKAMEAIKKLRGAVNTFQAVSSYGSKTQTPSSSSK